MWAQHNPRVSLGVIAMISKGSFWQIFNIIIRFVFRAFLYRNPLTVHMVLNWYWAHTLIKVTEQIKLVHEIDLACDLVTLFITLQESVSYKLRIYWAFSLYILTSVRNYFRNPFGKTSTSTWNEFDNWCNFTVSFSIRWW